MEAIELVRRTRFDIIFMDHMMPMMDGIEAVQNIRNDCGENGKLPVIIALTANAMEGVRENFLANGFQDFITKPIDRRAMHMVLLKWIPEEERVACDSWTDSLQSDSDILKKVIIEGIDTDEMSGHYSGSLEEYRELLELYCLDGKRKRKVLQELWEEKDYKGYGIEVHGLKSASANVGAMRISSMAKEQEKAVNRGDYSFVDHHVSKLLEEYGEQLGHIRKYLEANRTADSPTVQEKDTESKPKAEAEMGKTELLQGLEAGLESLEDFRAKDCARKLDEMMEYRLEADVETALGEIRGLLKLYEDDAAEQMLHELIGRIR